MITKTDLTWWLDLEPELDWQFATTYAEGASHEYVAAGKTPGLTEADVARAAHVIRTFGEPLKFYKATRIYLTTPMGWKHWDMQGGLIDESDVTLINRGRAEHVYGIQNAPRTASGVDSRYDPIATTWDRDHQMTDEEQKLTTDLIRQVFGDKLRRTLDVGCGTGWPIDAGLVDPVRYVGVDSSTAMLNTLAAKHPVLAGVHPMTFAQAEQQRVLCGTTFDTVLALGGTGSDLTPDEVRMLPARAKRAVLVMHRSGDDPTGSFATATELADTQHTIGRFTATVIR